MLAALYAIASMWLIFYINLYWVSNGGTREIVG